ncbi:hormone-sensitive lipase isoform X1 [Neodiprion fabricii]|uniref:hormone-sensitive lipase isoform X1 n=2 Tax=Neodiprion fabricii TaxID=2872261 RepID=UPI001ED93729|nr:hormone-sensitive lipase isoform X1 [Neodiprion fabricii]
MSTFDYDFAKPFAELEPPHWGALRELCKANAEYFATDHSEAGFRLNAALSAMLDHLEQVRPLYREISKIAPLFDFDSETPGNGYRSFLSIVDKCILHSVYVCRQLCCQRDSVLFRKSYYMREVEACLQLLASLCTCLQHLKTLYLWSDTPVNEKPSLFSSDSHSPQELLDQTESVNQYSFYGRCLGFQFCDSIKRVLKTISLCMVSFSEVYYANGTLIGRCTNSLKYLVDPEARARRIVNISQCADINFCKDFWLLNETDLVQRLPAMMMPTLAVNQMISIPPEELVLESENGAMVSIPVPCSHLGEMPLSVRLLSSHHRKGMIGSCGVDQSMPLSEGLVIHCHGGGFVAQSSRSHEVYLRDWAVQLGVPILSIDYSLAPEAPYPRALEEVFYAYAWALKNASTLLGSSARKVILAGDSAGANLNLGATLKCLELNVRKPDGIFMAYTPVLVEFIPSPARLLCLTDPLLPFGFMMRCLKAYASGESQQSQRAKERENGECQASETESFAEVSESDLIALALSPNGDETNEEHKLPSFPSDSTLNSVSLAEADAVQVTLDAATPSKANLREQTQSQEYITQFLDLYKNKSSENLAAVSNGERTKEEKHPRNEKSWSLFGWSFGGGNKARFLDAEGEKSPSDEFVFTVPRDPHLSPYLASGSTLAQIPPVKILTLELDPCLDDCVMFARKLKTLGNPVTLDILSGLPHGFLNFCLVSKEASDGSNLCVRRIRELLEYK